ncbi:MAG: hypothetical protein ABR500_10610 [Dermatophilaceae bacterium]|nr:hypothetical protein [Intrasporangiaceae bacterium]
MTVPTACPSALMMLTVGVGMLLLDLCFELGDARIVFALEALGFVEASDRVAEVESRF